MKAHKVAVSFVAMTIESNRVAFNDFEGMECSTVMRHVQRLAFVLSRILTMTPCTAFLLEGLSQKSACGRSFE